MPECVECGIDLAGEDRPVVLVERDGAWVDWTPVPPPTRRPDGPGRVTLKPNRVRASDNFLGLIAEQMAKRSRGSEIGWACHRCAPEARPWS